MPRTPTRPTVTSRVLALLAAFDDDRAGRTLTELAHTTGLPVSTAHRLLLELQEWGAVERDAAGRYRVGRRLWQLGTRAPVHRELREAALPPMLDLYEATRENVHLAVREGITALYVERLHGKSSVPLASRAGVALPLHATGVGKVLLAWADTEVIEQSLAKLERMTRYTIRERGRMMRELVNVRRSGYARTVEEMTLGTWSVAVPVFAPDGELTASLGLVTRTVHRELERYVPALQVAAAAVTRALSAGPTS